MDRVTSLGVGWSGMGGGQGPEWWAKGGSGAESRSLFLSLLGGRALFWRLGLKRAVG